MLFLRLFWSTRIPGSRYPKGPSGNIGTLVHMVILETKGNKVSKEKRY